MAGAGYKLFTTGQVLTAAEVNTYLQEQTVMVFNDAASRTTALSGVLAEGMVSYLKSTKVVEIYNGTAWASLDDPNAIQNTIVDAKGDLIAASAADTPARLAVGNNGETLVADSSASTGLRWQGSAIGKNAIYNSAFDIWQRGTSFAIPGSAVTYTADRWFGFRGATGSTISRQTGTNANRYEIRVQRDSGNTSTSPIYLAQAFEISDAIQYQGKTVTFSFWARAGANYSRASNGLSVVLNTGTGTSEANPFVASYTGSATPITSSVTLTTSWQRFSLSATLGSTVTQFTAYYEFVPTGTAGAADYFEISNVQLELGSVATAYSKMTNTLAGELQAAQRYYYRTSGSAGYQALAFGAAASATSAVATLVLPVTMRTASTDLTAGALYWETTAGSGQGGATVTAANPSTNTVRINIANLTGLTAGQAGILYTNNDANSYLAISAEL